jgi:hypothetical protein
MNMEEKSALKMLVKLTTDVLNARLVRSVLVAGSDHMNFYKSKFFEEKRLKIFFDS